MIDRSWIGVRAGGLIFGLTAFAAPVLAQTAEPSDSAVVILTVEMPAGNSFRTEVSDVDCPAQKMCGDYYGIHGYVIAGFEKLGLAWRESCRGRHGDRVCEVVELGGIGNSGSKRWVLFRGGGRSPYPYNRITREEVPEKITYKFVSARS
jgi:hypothetical protein